MRICEETNSALDSKVGIYSNPSCFLFHSTCSSSGSSSDGDGSNGRSSSDRTDGGGSSSSCIVAVGAGVVYCISSSRLCGGCNIKL